MRIDCDSASTDPLNRCLIGEVGIRHPGLGPRSLKTDAIHASRSASPMPGSGRYKGGVREREDRAVDADAERQRQDRREHERRGLPQGADRIMQVLQQQGRRLRRSYRGAGQALVSTLTSGMAPRQMAEDPEGLPTSARTTSTGNAVWRRRCQRTRALI